MVVVSPSLPLSWSSAIPPLAATSNRGAPGPRPSGRGPTGSVQLTASSTAAKSPERPVQVVRLYMIRLLVGVRHCTPLGGKVQTRAVGPLAWASGLPVAHNWCAPPYDPWHARTNCGQHMMGEAHR